MSTVAARKPHRSSREHSGLRPDALGFPAVLAHDLENTLHVHEQRGHAVDTGTGPKEDCRSFGLTAGAVE
jgi:hypothetical protein